MAREAAGQMTSAPRGRARVERPSHSPFTAQPCGRGGLRVASDARDQGKPDGDRSAEEPCERLGCCRADVHRRRAGLFSVCLVFLLLLVLVWLL